MTQGTVGKFHPHTFCAFFGKIKIFANLLYLGICRFSILSIFPKKRYKICKERLSQQHPKISLTDLARLGRKGFLVGPNENEHQFVKRIDFAKKSIADTSLKHLATATKISRADWEVVFRGVESQFLSAPRWLRGYYSNRKLMPWQAAVTWITSRHIPIIQLNRAFKKGHYFFYSRDEVLVHEAIHALRTSYFESRFEELFAYGVSRHRFRAFLGPLFRRPIDIWLFFFTCTLSIFAQVMLFSSDSLLFFLTGFAPFFYVAILGVKLAGDWRLLTKAKKKIKKLFPHLVDPSVLALRLTDKEVCLFARKSANTLLTYIRACSKRSLRWQQITKQLDILVNNN